jgi:molecular chaperone GrpE
MTDKKDKIVREDPPAGENPAPDPEKEIAELKDKFLRAMADAENTRRRAAADIENTARARAMSVAGEFLPLVDAIDAAAAHAPEDEGIRALKKAADNVLAKIGIMRIETIGQMLNPQFHNVIMAEESDRPANTIVRELQSGFMFGDMVLRSAMVAVAKEEKNADNQTHPL